MGLVAPPPPPPPPVLPLLTSRGVSFSPPVDRGEWDKSVPKKPRATPAEWTRIGYPGQRQRRHDCMPLQIPEKVRPDFAAYATQEKCGGEKDTEERFLCSL